MRLCSVLALSLLIGACGFHLRGSFELPLWMEKVHVQDAAPHKEVTIQLKQALASSGAVLTASPAEATVVVQLGQDKTTRRLLAAATGAHLKDYELKYEVALSVRDESGKVLVDNALIAVFREMVFDETRVLAKTSEQETMRREMIQDAVRQIMRRLQAVRPDQAINE